MIENVFSWSKSRDEQFRECQRKYFYDKYASWGGWEKNAPVLTRKAYVLKNLKNRWAWKGETVHHIIEHSLKALQKGRPLSLEEVLSTLTQTMRQDYRSSKAKKNWEDPKKCLGLFEHEYEKQISDAVWKDVHDSSAECLKNFYSSALYQELLGDDKNSWLLIEDLEEFQYEGAKIYVKLDFARRRNDNVEIFDWKTGKDDGGQSASVQIGAYALYAMQKWSVPVEKIRAFIFNLNNASPVPTEQIVNETVMNESLKTISDSIQGMRELLKEPLKNVPLSEEYFKFTENERLCSFCNFYKICDRWGSKGVMLLATPPPRG